MTKYLNLSYLSKISIQLVLVLLFALYLVPISPLFPTDGLDPSWMYVIDYASQNHMNFGSDLFFTFGPLGAYWFPHYYYNPNNYYVALLFSFLLAITVSVALFRIVESFTLLKQCLLLLSVFAGVVMGSLIGSLIGSSVWFILPLLFLGIAVKENKCFVDYIVLLLLIILISASVLVKFSHFPTALLSVLLVDLYLFYRMKKVPFVTPLFAGLLISLFFISGQQVSNVGSWFLGSFQTLTGYSESMQIFGNPSMAPLFLIISSIFYIVVLRASRRALSFEVILILLLSLTVLFMVFKNGFVRHDGHAIQAVSGMVFIFALVYALIFSRVDLEKVYQRWLYSLMALSVVLSVHVMDYYQNHLNVVQVLSNTASTFMQSSQSIPQLLTAEYKISLDKSYIEAKQTIKSKLDLSDIKGTVDIYPWDQAYVLANDLNYHPRPLFQSYSVYTPALIEKNINFLRSSNAPDTILFSIKEIDNRLPAMMEGASWLELMKRYDIVGRKGEFLKLEKTKQIKDYKLQALGAKTASFGQPVEVYVNNVFVKIEIKKNLFGKFLDLFYKMPLTEIELTYENGTKEVKRLIPGIASSGFIISPNISNIDDFESYVKGSGMTKVVSFTIHGNPFFYEGNIGVEQFEIERIRFNEFEVLK